MPAPDKLNEDSSILEVESRILSIVADLRSRIRTILIKYGDVQDILNLPPYGEVSKNPAIIYQTELNLIQAADEVIQIKVRMSLVQMQLRDIQNTRISFGNKNFELQLKKSIAAMLQELSDLKFDLVDVLKSINNRIDILKGFSYTGE